jgi:hypothetical protein
MCFAATPVVAGPRGGASFGGGGAHFGPGAGAFAAPHIASPSVTAPHFSAPSPHSARNIRTPLTAPVVPQLFARPGYLLRHVTPGQVDSAPSVRSVRQIPRPTNQAANAFALSGVHRFGSSLRERSFPYMAQKEGPARLAGKGGAKYLGCGKGEGSPHPPPTQSGATNLDCVFSATGSESPQNSRDCAVTGASSS